MNENLKQNPEKKKFFGGRRGMIVGLLAVFALLICGYFFILRPLLREEDVEIDSIEPIWQDEVIAGSNSLLLYPHYTQADIQEIAIHNPDNGEGYQDWGFFYNETADESRALEANTFYLTDYTYASFDSDLFSQMTTTTGFVICSARMEDHCTDYSKYGLDYEDLSDMLYFTLTLRDGTQHTVLIGAKTPTGSSYYIRSLDESVELATGETKVRDSVYILSSVYFQDTVMSTPMAMVTPYLGLPVNGVSALDSFALFVNEEKYFYPDPGETEAIWQPAFYAKALKSKQRDPFSVFTGVSIYETVTPEGYYSSTEMESIIQAFGDFQGDSVLAMERETLDEEGNLTTEPLDEEVMKEYHLDNPYYQLLYVSEDIPSVIYFSELQEDSYYYAYSVNFNVICKVSINTAYFLNWDLESFVLSHIFFTSIENIQSIAFEGSYYDLGVEQDYRKGLMNVDLNFRLDGKGTDLIVTETGTGQTMDTVIFRKLYAVLLQTDIREEMAAEEIEKAMQGDPMLTITVVTKETIVYKTDEEGNTTNEVDYTRPSVMRIFRFYECSEGRSLVTTEDIDQNGESLGEHGNFYGMSAAAQKLMSDSLDLLHGVAIDNTIHG